MRLYNTFKHVYDTDKYVLSCDKCLRSHIAQFRSGILPLNIEIGRHRNLEIKDRLCTVCDLQEIENEIHFMCECPAYENFRNILYDNVKNIIENFEKCSNEEKFKQIMLICNKSVGRFIVDSFNHRRNLMYKRC